MFSENELPDVSLCPQALLHLLCRHPSPLNLPGKGWYFSYFTLRNSCLRYVWTSIAVHSFAILLVSMFKSIKLQAPLTLSCLFFLTLTFIFQDWFYPWVKCGFFAELRAQSHQWSCGLTSQSHQVRSFCTLSWTPAIAIQPVSLPTAKAQTTKEQPKLIQDEGLTPRSSSIWHMELISIP